MSSLHFVGGFLLFSCWLFLVSGYKVHTASPNSLSAQERKPFASPEKPAILESYRRFKRQTAKSIQEFQDFVRNAKETCGAEMGFSSEELQKSFLYSDNLTPKEKCLIACILKRTKIMDKSNRLSTHSVGRIAEIVSNSNALVISIAIASADNCNRNVNAPDPCDAAYQINKCIGNEMRAHKVKLVY